MTLEEARKVTASWARFPPAPIALRRLELTLRTIFVGSAEETGGSPATSRPPTEDELRAEVAMLNAGMM